MSQYLKRSRAFLNLVAIPLVLIGCSLSIEAQKSQQRSMTADRLLSLGDFYLKNNDITDAADRYYKQVINSFPGTRQAGVAQFNRGSYWQKKFYILREKGSANSKAAQSALIEAEGQYYDFIDKFADTTNTTDLLADAGFNLALVYLQRNNSAYAVGWLNRMLNSITKRDGQVYIYFVVWSSNPADVVDRNVDSTALANFTRVSIGSGLTVDQVFSQVKQWCRKQ
jgi:tetratricopeptide (TPR) repeat protein